MLKRIMRSGQLSIPKKLLAQLHLREGDYVNIEFADASILIKPANGVDLSPEEYERLAAKLGEVEKERGMAFPDADGARNHLRQMMK
jgi:AbrB family looped-hinge helix DNA binding protein